MSSLHCPTPVPANRQHGKIKVTRDPRQSSFLGGRVNSVPTMGPWSDLGGVPLVHRCSVTPKVAPPWSTGREGPKRGFLFHSSLSTRGAGAADDVAADVAIVGAGIIGLAVAAELLMSDPGVTVVVVDRKGPCAGATGAGQGYLWMGHRTPSTPTWALANHSKERWEQHLVPLLQEVTRSAPGNQRDKTIRRGRGPGPFKSSLGWTRTGSMLFTTSEAQNQRMRDHVSRLVEAGVPAHLLDAREASREEPELVLPAGCAAALVPGDSQIDAILATEALLQLCRSHRPRYSELFDEEVTACLWDSGAVSGLRTRQRRVHSSAVVVCAGAWAAPLMESVAKSVPGPECAGATLVPRVAPRKGHLIEVSGLGASQPLRHGLMEFEYTGNYAPRQAQALDTPAGTGSGQGSGSAGSAGPSPLSQERAESPPKPDIAVTVTADHAGRYLIGSSRQFLGFSDEVQKSVVEDIMRKAAEFVPSLAPLSSRAAARDLVAGGKVRVGLRPWASDGRPVIGPVPGIPGLVFAVGHEGSGLTLATGTAEMVASHILSRPCPVDSAPFLPGGRLVNAFSAHNLVH